MNVLYIDSSDLNELNNIADFSQLGITFSSIDKIKPENKINSIAAVLKKIRLNGELVIRTTNCNKVIDALCKSNVETQTGLSLLKNVQYHTEPMELVNFIVSLEPNIILYKLIEDNFETILTLKKVNY
jgi:hypothetical protein